jgi:fatty acid desaturase
VRRRPAIDPALLGELRALSPARWLAACAFDWLLIVATFVIVGAIDHPLVYALAIFPIGSRQQGLGALFHDAAHRLVTRDRRLNDATGSLFAAWPLGLTLGGYRRYHLVHHRKLGSPGDPEMGHKRALPHWDLPLAPRQALHFASDLVGGGIPHLAAAGRMTRPVRAGEVIGLSIFWIGVALAFWQLHLLWVPLLWVVSIATTFWSGVRLRIFTEHLGTRDTHRITMHPWLEAIVMPHAIGLHWEHHHFPEVPFHRLRALRAALPSPRVIPLHELLRDLAKTRQLPSGDIADVTRDTDGSEGSSVATLDAPAELPLWTRLAAHVALPLAIGVGTYLFLRPDPPVAAALRAALHLGPLASAPVGSFLDVLPDAAWAYAVTATPLLVWWRGPRGARLGWTAAAVALAVGWELGQRVGVTPGGFSTEDLVGSATAAALALIVLYPRPRLEASRSATAEAPSEAA